MRLQHLIVHLLCLCTLSEAETHRAVDGYSAHKLNDRNLSSHDGESKSYARRSRRSGYRRSGSLSGSSKYRPATTKATYMSSLYYYNNDYSRTENCADYVEHNYCMNKQGERSKKSIYGLSIFGALCVIWCCWYYSVRRAKFMGWCRNCCENEKQIKGSRTNFENNVDPNASFRRHMEVNR